MTRVNGSICCGEEEEEKSPKEVNITQADGGWIARKMGGKRDYNDPQIVSEDLDELMKSCKKFLQGK